LTSAPSKSRKQFRKRMPGTPAFHSEFKSSLPPPTDEELATMMELQAEQAQILESRGLYNALINSLYIDFEDTYKEVHYLCQENDNLRVELVKVADKFGFEIPEEDTCKQSSSTQAAESIEDFFLHILKARGSERIRSGNLPPGFPSTTPSSDLQPHKGAAAFDVEEFAAENDSSLGAHEIRTAAPDAAVGGLKPRTHSTLEASGASGKAAPCASSKTIESNLMKSAQSWKTGECDPCSQRSSKCMPVQQPAAMAAKAAKATLPDAAKPKTLPKLNTSTGTELMAGPRPENSLMNDTMRPVNYSECELAIVQGHVESWKSPSQHVIPLDSCSDLSVVSPLQDQAVLQKTSADSQGKCSSAVEQHLHPHPALETTGPLLESSLLSSSISSIGGATTLVVRNIPTRYTKEMLLKEWVPDGTFDFFYLPFSFKQKKVAGYSFINFTSNAAALAFYSQWHKKSLFSQGSSTKLHIVAAEVQGLDENVRHLINSKVRRITNPKYLPSVFDGPHEVPFSAFVEKLEARQHVQLQTMDASTLHSESAQSLPQALLLYR